MKDMKKLMCCIGCGVLMTSMVCVLGCNCDKTTKFKKDFNNMVDDAIDNAIEAIMQAADKIMDKE